MKYEKTFIEGLPEPLKQEEIIALYKKGNKESIDKVIIHNIRLVLYIAKTYKQYQAIEKDLVSIGIIGLIKGAYSFDVNKEILFSTYITRCIENEIFMYFRKVRKEEGVVSLENFVSIDTDGKELHIEDFFPSEQAQKDLEDCENQDVMKKVREVVSSLPDKEKNIIEKRYGFIDGKIITQAELADELGISQSYVSRVENRILEKLKHQLNEKDIVKSSNKKLNKSNNEKTAKKRRPRRDYTNIYTYFNEYDKILVDEALGKINDNYMNVLHTIWGENLDELNKENLTPEIRTFLIYNITPTLIKKLKQQTIERCTTSLSILDKEVAVNRTNVLEQCKIEIDKRNEFVRNKIKQKIPKEG